MIAGEILPASGLLVVRGLVRVPELDAMGVVPFVVDTGADRTCLIVRNLEDLEADFGVLTTLPSVPSTGFGGEQTAYLARGTLEFRDEADSYQYDMEFLVPDSATTPALPSVLGRDILQRWRMVYDHQEGELSFTVRKADRTVTRPPVG